MGVKTSTHLHLRHPIRTNVMTSLQQLQLSRSRVNYGRYGWDGA